MKKLSNTFLKVGKILAIVDLVLLAICAITCFALLAIVDPVRQVMAENGADAEAIEIATITMIASFIASGVALALILPGYPVVIWLSDKARKEPRHGLYIANIVMGVLFGCYFNVAAGILGLINLKREARQAIE